MSYIGTPIDTTNQFQSLVGKRFSGDASTTAFTLDVAPTSTLDIEVFVENVRQDPNSAYSLSGTTLTFAAAPPSGTNNIYVVHQAKAVGTISPAAGTVNADSFDNTVISGHTALAATPDDTDELLISDAGTIKRIDYSLIKSTNTPIFSVRLGSSVQNLTHNTLTNLTFDTEEIDTDSAFASNQFTVPSGKGGKYYLESRVNLYDNGANVSSLRLMIYKGSNSSPLALIYDQNDGSDERVHVNISVSIIADLSEGDVIGCAALQTTTDSGGAESYGGDKGTRFLGYRLA